MTVSPDGRSRRSSCGNTSYSQTETAGTTGVSWVSLTGERIEAWDDEVYKIVGSGSSGQLGPPGTTCSRRASR